MMSAEGDRTSTVTEVKHGPFGEEEGQTVTVYFVMMSLLFGGCPHVIKMVERLRDWWEIVDTSTNWGLSGEEEIYKVI